MRRGLPIRNAVSAGGVVYSLVEGRPQVVICRVAGRDIWSLPKGTPDPGESTLETAVREVQEETGLQVEAGEKAGSIDYWFVQDGFRVHKVVHFWLMTAIGGSLDEHDGEFDRVEWRPADEAMDMLSYKGEREILTNALEWMATHV